MKTALIFLNGYYDLRYPEFYKGEMAWGLENGYPLICADGGLRLFNALNQIDDRQFYPDMLIGDLDSSTTAAIEQLRRSGTHIVQEWIGRVDKDYTDGQLAVISAIEEYNCQRIIIYGGLSRPDGYETDHFLGNLKLMRYGLRLLTQKREGIAYTAEMRDVFQTIHFVVSDLTLVRKNAGLQRVSLVAEHPHATVESSTNLRWDLTGRYIDPDVTETLRNEFIPEADKATIHLAEGSDPVYVIHNWYET